MMQYRNTKVVNLVQARTRRKLIEIRNALAPDAGVDAGAELLAKSIGAQMKQLDPDERRRMVLKTAIAMQELGALRDELIQHKNDVAGELRKLHTHKSAANAYMQSQIGPKLGRR